MTQLLTRPDTELVDSLIIEIIEWKTITVSRKSSDMVMRPRYQKP